MREQILSEIQRLAKESGGQPPGFRLFEQKTGIRQGAWRGVYWARWGDAVAEAGLTPNVALAKYDEGYLLGRIADVCRKLGKFRLQWNSEFTAGRILSFRITNPYTVISNRH